MFDVAYTYGPLEVYINKKGDDTYEIGVDLAGKLFVFGGFKAGGFEEDLREAHEAQRLALQNPPQSEPVV